MLTPDQEKWINHLSDTKTIKIVPFDPTCEEKYLQVKVAVQRVLGADQDVVHSGASSLGISGQDEIDIYVPVSAKDFNKGVERIKNLYGDARSFYPLKRAHFVTAITGKHIDIFVINEEDAGWKDSLLFMSFLRSHSEALETYRRFKESNAGLTMREYYRRKTEFINEILSKT
jgi:GrpB-like predicted nucleotidyltransferase (UPF0157 family)